jgi:hypothetical protein
MLNLNLNFNPNFETCLHRDHSIVQTTKIVQTQEEDGVAL